MFQRQVINSWRTEVRCQLVLIRQALFIYMSSCASLSFSNLTCGCFSINLWPHCQQWRDEEWHSQFTLIPQPLRTPHTLSLRLPRQGQGASADSLFRFQPLPPHRRRQRVRSYLIVKIYKPQPVLFDVVVIVSYYCLAV